MTLSNAGKRDLSEAEVGVGWRPDFSDMLDGQKA